MNRKNKIGWGLTSVIVGTLFLLKYLQILPASLGSWIFDYRNLFILIGLIFTLVGKNRSLGLILILVGAGLYLNEIITWTKTMSNIIWPILLIVVGVVLLFGGGIRNLFK